jgi:hypothetical protein
MAIRSNGELKGLALAGGHGARPRPLTHAAAKQPRLRGQQLPGRNMTYSRPILSCSMNGFIARSVAKATSKALSPAVCSLARTAGVGVGHSRIRGSVVIGENVQSKTLLSAPSHRLPPLPDQRLCFEALRISGTHNHQRSGPARGKPHWQEFCMKPTITRLPTHDWR